MVRICSICKKNVVEGSRDISFVHKGLKFTTNRWPFDCNECAKKEYIARFDDFTSRYNLVVKEEDKVKVDWKLYVEAWETKILEKMSDFLMDLGILSLKMKGNWDVVTTSSIGLNPWFMKQFYLYFVRKEDAIEFARLRYSNTFYGWMLRQRTKEDKYITFSDDEILKSSVIK